jgi:GH24 family phage-related lysozyme (muramidase)/co-chaperonin GroES (HSP10)
MAYSLKFVLDTFLKQSTALSNQLPIEQLQYIDAGTELPIIALQPIGSDHLQVTLGTDAQGKQIFFKGRNTWYVYRSTVQILRDGQPVTFAVPPTPTSPAPTPPTSPTPTPTPTPPTAPAPIPPTPTPPAPTSPAQPVYVLNPVSDTWLKQSTASGASLPDSQRQLLNARTILPISSYDLVEDNHLKIALGKDSQGNQIFFKALTTWYVYRPDVQILRDGKVILSGGDPAIPPPPLYVIKPTSDTWLKQSTAIGASLSDSQRQFLNAGTVLAISSYDLIEDNHIKITLGKDGDGKQIFFKGLTTWYVYRPDVQILRDGKVIVASDPAGPDPVISDPGHRQISRQGLQLLKSFEGFSATAYQDIVGVWTIGYGTTSGVRPGMRVTQSQAEDLLRRDLFRFETAVTDLVKVPLNENQFSALVSFVYNVGEGALAGSTLLRVLNQGNYREAANQFMRWNRAGGNEIAGLTRRRRAEQELFLGRG